MLGIARPFTAAKLDFSQVLMDKFDPKVEVSKDVCLCLSQKLRSKLIPLASEFTNWSQLEYFAINGLNLGAERFERLVDLVRRKSLMLDQSHHCFPELSLQLTPLLFQTFQSCGIFHNQSNASDQRPRYSGREPTVTRSAASRCWASISMAHFTRVIRALTSGNLSSNVYQGIGIGFAFGWNIASQRYFTYQKQNG